MNKSRIGKNLILIVVVAVIAFSIFYFENKKVKRANFGEGNDVVTIDGQIKTADYAAKSLKYPKAKELVNPDGYINTDGKPITIGELVGKKVILLDFWTYSCINCQRTLPYLTSWYEKYKDQGFEIIGVHTPEFEFEKKYENVQAAVNKFNVKYPVVQDNQFATWDAYNNRFWPTHYLIDINGLVVEQHIGEGRYEETEKKIQELLNERKEALGEEGKVGGNLTSFNQQIESRSPEIYFGSARNSLLANGKPNSSGVQTFQQPSEIQLNKLYLSGQWNFQNEYAENQSKGAKIIFKYNAKSVYFVGSSKLPSGVKLTIMRDGKVVGEEKGGDLDLSSSVIVKEPGLYKLIEEKEAGMHTIEIIIENPGLEAFTFTFG